MLVFPNCKINIGLNIISRRSDGFHNLETVFFPIYKLYDAIEILLVNDNPQLTNGKFRGDVLFQASGLPVSGTEQDNLCLKAYQLLKKDFPDLPPVHLCLHKTIPMGAGLGGGSADGAFTLGLLSQKFNLKLLTSKLLDYALQLGSDCPFFVINKPCFAEGRGEMLEPLSIDLTGYSIILVNPGITIATATAFAGITPQVPNGSLRELIAEPIETWQTAIQNDFEKTVFRLYPLLPEIKEKFYESGAVYASMSGTGSTMYGIYKTENLPVAKLYPAFFEQHLHL